MELAAEMKEAGFDEIRVLAVQVPVWSASEAPGNRSGPALRGKPMELLLMVERDIL